MSKATEALRARGIHNEHNLCSKCGGIAYVVYEAGETGAFAMRGPGFSVHPMRGQKFSDHWRDGGAKRFPLYSKKGSLKEQRAQALAEALTFAAARVSADRPTRWGRDPFGAWQTMDVLERAGVKAKDVREVHPPPDTEPPLSRRPGGADEGSEGR